MHSNNFFLKLKQSLISRCNTVETVHCLHIIDQSKIYCLSSHVCDIQKIPYSHVYAVNVIAKVIDTRREGPRNNESMPKPLFMHIFLYSYVHSATTGFNYIA